jgi:ribosomal protein S1
VIDANRGGLMVKVGRIEGFLPVSQLTPEHYPRVDGGDKQRILEILQSFVGKLMRTKVIDVNEAEEKLIVSAKYSNGFEIDVFLKYVYPNSHTAGIVKKDERSNPVTKPYIVCLEILFPKYV